MIDDRRCAILVDTSATKNIVRLDVIGARRLLTTSWQVRTASGAVATVYGTAYMLVTRGNVNKFHCDLVADEEDKVILGMA